MPPIRLTSPSDVGPLLTLLGEFYAEAEIELDRARAERALHELVLDPTLGRVWLILSSDEPVGYIAVTFGFSPKYHGRDAFVDDLYIRRRRRGQGLGSAVLAAVLASCRQLGIQAVHLEVDRDNARGQALYRKQGFRDNDRQLLTRRLGDEVR